MREIRKLLILKAGSLALCSRLNRLYGICCKQKTISTGKLLKELDRLQEYSKDDAVFLRGVVRKLDEGKDGSQN